MEVKMKKTLLLCLFVFFFLSGFGNLSAVSLPRSFRLGNQKPRADQTSTTRDQMRMMEEEFARMGIDKDDYPVSGANNRHDPKSPGRH